MLTLSNIDMELCPNLHHFYPGMGLKFGVLRFSCNENNRGSCGIHIFNLHLLQPEIEDKHN